MKTLKPRRKIKSLLQWLKDGCDAQNCPACWEERGYDDCDAGCYLFPESWFCVDGKCYMPHFLAKFLSRRPLYLLNHQHDGYGEWYQEHLEREEAFYCAMFSAADIECFTLAYKANDGTLYELERDSWQNRMWRAQDQYDDYLREQQKRTLGEKWRELLQETARRTIMRPVNFVASYILK